MTHSYRIPIHLLTGFLGSGKTTLLTAMLRDPSMQRTAVIVNEFGELGLDHMLVASGVQDTVLLDSGCLYSLNGDEIQDTLMLLRALRQRGEVAAFDRVIIETSGLADPVPVLQPLLTSPLIGRRAVDPRPACPDPHAKACGAAAGASTQSDGRRRALYAALGKGAERRRGRVPGTQPRSQSLIRELLTRAASHRRGVLGSVRAVASRNAAVRRQPTASAPKACCASRTGTGASTGGCSTRSRCRLPTAAHWPRRSS